MSYDISLKDPVTNIVAEVPGHLMIGGTTKQIIIPKQACLHLHYWDATAANALKPLYAPASFNELVRNNRIFQEG